LKLSIEETDRSLNEILILIFIGHFEFRKVVIFFVGIRRVGRHRQAVFIVYLVYLVQELFKIDVSFRSPHDGLHHDFGAIHQVFFADTGVSF